MPPIIVYVGVNVGLIVRVALAEVPVTTLALSDMISIT